MGNQEKPMVIKKILFPTKFRELAFNSLESLLVLKKAGLKEIVLSRIILRDEVGFVPFGGYLKKEEEKIREETKIRFEDWQKSLSEQGIMTKKVIEVGDPVPQIMQVAEQEEVDLIVIGRKKRTDTEKSFIGSYTHDIITRSGFPVFVSKYMVQFRSEDAMLTKVNDRPFETPLFAADWSEQSERIIDLLIALKSVVRKVFVFHDINLKKHDSEEFPALEKESQEKLDGYCTRFRDAGIEAEPHLGAGGVLDEILRVSREREASMIVIGNTCKDHFMRDMLLRSLTYQVAKHSELPTLLVP
jgi:nucleotide-binding universal stress UspA family protein